MKLLQSAMEAPDLLPLPALPWPTQLSGRSSRVRRRHRLRLQLREVAEHIRLTIHGTQATGTALGRANEYAVGRFHELGTSTQQKAWRRLAFHAQRLVRARRVAGESLPTGASAIDELGKRCQGDVYGRWMRQAVYEPFQAALVVEPEADHRPILMLEALPDELSEAYSEINRLISTSVEKAAAAKEMNHRYDKILGPRSEYIKYLHRADVRDLWELRPAEEVEHTLSLATVWKKNHKDLRKICLSVLFNNAS